MAAQLALLVGDQSGLQLKTLLDPNGHELVGVDHRDHHHPMRMVMVVAGPSPLEYHCVLCGAVTVFGVDSPPLSVGIEMIALEGFRNQAWTEHGKRILANPSALEISALEI